jgi:hypothetical protein
MQVLLGLTHDQLLQLVIDSGSASFPIVLLKPFAPHQVSMPAKHRFWLNQSNQLSELVGRPVGLIL